MGTYFSFPLLSSCPVARTVSSGRGKKTAARIASHLQLTNLSSFKITVAQAHRVSPQQLAVYSVLPVRHNLQPKRPVSLAATTTQQTQQTPLSLPKRPRYSAASQISRNSSNKQAVVDCLAPTWRPQSQAVSLAATQLQQAPQAVVYLEIQQLQLPSQPRLVEACLAHPRSSLRPQQLQEECSALAPSQQTTKRREIQVVYLGRSQPHQQEEACSASLRLLAKACCMFLLLRPCFSRYIF